MMDLQSAEFAQGMRRGSWVNWPCRKPPTYLEKYSDDADPDVRKNVRWALEKDRGLTSSDGYSANRLCQLMYLGPRKRLRR